MARPAQWPLHDLTLDDLLGERLVGQGARRDGNPSLASIARAHRGGSDAVGRWDALPSVGVAAAATVVVTLTFGSIPSAHSAVGPADHATEQASASTVAMPAGETLVPAGVEAGKLTAGFAKPASLGRLAEDLPASQAIQERVRYAALGRNHHKTKHKTKHKHRAATYSSTRLSGHISTGGKPTACLPGDLKRALNEAAAKFGHIRITSTSRSHSHNRRVGGAPRSLHLECRAVDFNFHGSRRGALIKFLKNHDAVGGVGVYGSGHIHIDDGPHRRW